MAEGDYDVPEKIQPRPRLWIGILAGVIYGLTVRLAFGADSNANTAWFNTLTWAFLTFVPLTLGALTIYFSPKAKRDGVSSAFFLPWITSVVFLGVASVLALEASLCIWMASPFFFLVSGLGGVLMRFILRVRNSKSAGYILTLLMISPFLTSPLEARLSRPDMYRIVENHIVIRASPEIIWDEIVRVAPIQPQERRLTFFQLLGIPQPVEATMDVDSAGGLRHSTYENGMAFNERVLVWQPLELLRFEIVPDPYANLPLPFNEINGAYFAMVDGIYRIAPQPDGSVILQLASTHRLSTSFNAYGGLWTDMILSDLQQYILEIIKGRAEAKALAA